MCANMYTEAYDKYRNRSTAHTSANKVHDILNSRQPVGSHHISVIFAKLSSKPVVTLDQAGQLRREHGLPFALTFKEYNRREATVTSELHSPVMGETLLHQMTCLLSWEKILSGFVLLSAEHLQTQGTGGFRLHRSCFLHPFLMSNRQQSTNYINYRQVYCWLTSVVPVPPPQPCASCHHERAARAFGRAARPLTAAQR